MGRQKTKERPLYPTSLEKQEATKLTMLRLETKTKTKRRGTATTKTNTTSKLIYMNSENAIQALSLLYTLSVGTRLPELMTRLASSSKQANRSSTQFNTPSRMKIYLFLPCQMLGENLSSLPICPRTEDESVAMSLMKFYKKTFQWNDTDEDSIEYCVRGLPSFFVAVTGKKKNTPSGYTMDPQMTRSKISFLVNWEGLEVLSALTFLPTKEGNFVPWLATSNKTDWLNHIYGALAPRGCFPDTP